MSSSKNYSLRSTDIKLRLREKKIPALSRSDDFSVDTKTTKSEKKQKRVHPNAELNSVSSSKYPHSNRKKAQKNVTQKKSLRTYSDNSNSMNSEDYNLSIVYDKPLNKKFLESIFQEDSENNDQSGKQCSVALEKSNGSNFYKQESVDIDSTKMISTITIPEPGSELMKDLSQGLTVTTASQESVYDAESSDFVKPDLPVMETFKYNNAADLDSKSKLVDPSDSVGLNFIVDPTTDRTSLLKNREWKLVNNNLFKNNDISQSDIMLRAKRFLSSDDNLENIDPPSLEMNHDNVVKVFQTNEQVSKRARIENRISP
jgi:hypothetical protein